jgi:tetratricopeptide (TPR) repeat protein
MTLYSVKTITRSSNWKNNQILFTHDVKTVSNSAPAQNNAGIAYLNSYYPGENDKAKKMVWLEDAINAFNKAAELCPGYMDPQRNLVSAYSKKEDYQNAIVHAEIIRRNSPGKRIDDFKQLAFLYFKTNQYQKAVNELDSAIRYFPDSAKVYNEKGFVLAANGSYQDAITLYQKAISLDPQYAEAYSNMGCAYCSMKQYSEGLQYLYKSISLDPNDMESYNFIGQAYKDIGQTDSANLYFGKANQIKKTNKR